MWMDKHLYMCWDITSQKLQPISVRFCCTYLHYQGLGSQYKQAGGWVLPCCPQLPTLFCPQDTSNSSVSLCPLLMGQVPPSHCSAGSLATRKAATGFPLIPAAIVMWGMLLPRSPQKSLVSTHLAPLDVKNLDFSLLLLPLSFLGW